jgi:hypothetical protein
MAATIDSSPEAQADRLERLETKLDSLTASLAAVSSFSQKTGLLAEAAGDGASFVWDEAAARGVDPIARGQQGLDLAIRLSDPKQMAMVEKLLDAADAIDPADLDRVLAASTAVLGNPHFHALLAGAPDALAVVGPATTALSETRKSGFESVGPFGMLGVLLDGGVQRAVGFSIAVAKRFGAKM